MYTHSYHIRKTRNGEFAYTVRGRNGIKIGTAGESNKRKAHVLKIVKMIARDDAKIVDDTK